MVLKKRLDYGFNVFHIPVVPRAPRSIRRRGPRKIAVEDCQICPFELLAAVAGKLLQENESSTSSNASEAKDLLGIHTKCLKEETAEEDNKGSRSECLDHGSCVENVLVPELTPKEHNNNPISGDIDSLLEHITNITNSDSSKKVVDCELKLGVCSSNPTEGNLGTKVGGSSFPLQHSGDHINQSTDLTMANTCGANKQVEKKCLNSEQLINPDNNVQLSLYRDQLPPSASFPKHRSDVKLGIRDDDENSFRCNKFSTKIRAFRPQPRNSYGRFRKMLSSKYWKVAPKFRDLDLSNTVLDEGMKTHYHSRKRIHTLDRYIKEAPFKKRLLYNHSFVVDYDQQTSSESICNTFEKGIKGEKHSSDSIIHRRNGVSTAVKAAHKKQKDSKVKLSIKSFKVPELFIEIPETATIGSLKRTVMETVTAILGGGLRVGLVLQGKKVRDDNRTLQQAGIYSSNLDTLAFILEPSSPPVAETCKDSAHLSKSAEDQKLQRSPVPIVRFHHPQVTEMDIGYESNLEIVTSSLAHADALTDETKQDSKALVLIPAPKAEPLALMPMNPKAKRSEFSQRRARRPFSVTEVEALVEAVETLGTGRWRDVKMRAFDNANHRTYVDLKDKWKTLVHTASISSQQRRGEPVPQELLDRVLSAHAYWTIHQSKPHGKHNPEPLKAIDARSKPVEV